MRFILLLTFALAAPAWASVVLPADGPYYRWHKGDTLYIFDGESREVAPQLAAYHQVFRRMYDKSYGWKLDQRQDLILTSHRQQVANAYASTVPNIKSVWFPAGAGALENSADSSWLMTLDSHETAHLYQLNAKGEFPARLSKLVGNAPFAFLLVWPVFIQPNYFTPRFLLEGNAVLQESRIHQGGRLFSGEVRAEVLAQIRAGQISPSRLINDEFRFPFGRLAYHQGGYFQAHLAAKHGVEKTNQFFKAQGDRYLWPLILNKTFREHFGASYPQEIREYVRGLEGLAAEQKFATADPLLTATFMGSLNHDVDRIWFMATDGTARPELEIFDKKTQQITSRTIDLPTDKVFFEGDTPLAVGSEQHDLHHISYSLYGEHRRLIERYRGQVVTDQRAGKTAALAASHSWLEPRLLLDGVPYDVAHSSAILDSAGNVFYFRQNGAERILYRNREPMFKFDGFYGKPTEVTADGTVYFIGATPHGSTLYRYQNQEITRVLASDRVVDARRINEREFLAIEIGPDGHALHVMPTQITATAPVVYSYGFVSENVIPDPVDPNAEKETDRYHGLANLRYSLLDLSLVYSRTPGFGAMVNAHFADPMDYHNLSLGYAGTQFRDQAMQFSYAYTRYLADLVLKYRYKEEWWEQADGFDQTAYNQDVEIGVRLPFLRWRLWDGVLGMGLTYELEDTHYDPTHPPSFRPYDTQELYGLKTTFSLERNETPRLGMYRWRHLGFNYTNSLQTLENQWTKKNNSNIVNTSFQYGLPLEMYLSAYASAAWAETHDIHVKVAQLPVTDGMHIPLLTSHTEHRVKQAGSARLEFHKVFNLRAYSPRVPIGLDRVAPLVVAQGIALDDAKEDEYPHSIFEWGYGADFQVLTLHSMHGLFRILRAYNTSEPEPERETRFEFKLQQTF